MHVFVVVRMFVVVVVVGCFRPRRLACGLGFRVWGLGFRVWGLGCGVWGVGFGVWG